MRIWAIVGKDLRQIVRERKSFLFLLIMPIAFTLLFGFGFSGLGGAADDRLPIGLADEDGSVWSGELVALLTESAVVRLETAVADVSAADLPAQVVAETIAAAVLIPAGFGAEVRQGVVLPVTVVAEGQVGMTVQTEVETAVSRLVLAAQTARISTETAVSQGLLPDAAAEQAHFQSTFAIALAAWDNPRLRVAGTTSSAVDAMPAGESTDYNIYAHTSPGMMAQFAIAGLISAATILVLEKKNRALHRLLTTNLSAGEILLGHYLAMVIMLLAQMGILILFGQLFLHLPYVAQLPATLLLTLVTALFCASLGLCIGALAAKEEQVIVFSLLPMFLLSALGGAWVPLEVTPLSFQRVAFLTPLAWVLDGYKDILVRGQGVGALGTAVMVLLGYTAVLLAVAGWRMRRVLP